MLRLGLLGYDDGRVATLLISLKHHTPGLREFRARRAGLRYRRGFTIHIASCCIAEARNLRRSGRPPLGTGYSHELIEVTEGVRAGRTESVIMPLQDTLAVQRVLNEACENLASQRRTCGGVC